jgi:spoIIIJ-associated protein
MWEARPREVQLRRNTMTKSAEATGRTIEDATKECLDKLGVPIERADISIIEHPSKGILGIGSRPARVRAEVRERQAKEQAKFFTSEMLSMMGISSQINITENSNSIQVQIETAGTDGLLIGKHGRTLRSFQYLLNRMMNQSGEKKKIVLDVSGYRKRREEFLTAKALSLAKNVRSAGRRIKMAPLEADERRIVHVALQSESDIRTYSVGQGRVKSVVVAPAGESSKSKKGSQSSRSKEAQASKSRNAQASRSGD